MAKAKRLQPQHEPYPHRELVGRLARQLGLLEAYAAQGRKICEANALLPGLSREREEYMNDALLATDSALFDAAELLSEYARYAEARELRTMPTRAERRKGA